jgi:hypothetical protein
MLRYRGYHSSLVLGKYRITWPSFIVYETCGFHGGEDLYVAFWNETSYGLVCGYQFLGGTCYINPSPPYKHTV